MRLTLMLPLCECSVAGQFRASRHSISIGESLCAGHFAVHHFDGTKSILLARVLHLLRVDVEPEPVAAKAALRVGLHDEEAHRAFDLHLDARVLERRQSFDILRLPEIGIAVLVDVGGLEIGLAAPAPGMRGGRKPKKPKDQEQCFDRRDIGVALLNAGKSCATNTRRRA